MSEFGLCADSRRTWDGRPLTPGLNVDPVDYDAGMRMLASTWPEASPETRQVVLYALQRWARGEEPQAERAAIDASFHGVSFTVWRMVLAAAVAEGEEEL